MLAETIDGSTVAELIELLEEGAPGISEDWRAEMLEAASSLLSAKN